MTVRMTLLERRKRGITHEDCIGYLERKHVPLVKELPALRRFTTSTPIDPDETGYDVIVRLWFETTEDLEAAVDSDEWQRAMRDADRFVDVEETIVATSADETLRQQAVPAELI